jgi:hypothetical protein
MSTLQVTTITTVNNTTPLILQTGNTGGGQIVLNSANSDVQFVGNVRVASGFTGDGSGLTLPTANVANAAFGKANSALQNTTGTFNGSLYFPTGNVFIGTNSSGVDGSDFQVQTANATVFAHYVGNARGGLQAFSSQRLGLVTTTSGDNLVFGYTSGVKGTLTEYMRIKNSNGYVGIGNNNPASALTVSGSGFFSGITLNNRAGVDIGFNTNYAFLTSGDRGASTLNRLDFEGSSFRWLFGFGTSQQMELNSSGLGIGITPTSPLQVYAPVADSLPILRLSASSNTSSPFQWISTSLAPNIGAGQNLIHLIGKAQSTPNSGYIGYKHAGDGSYNNSMTIGMYGADNLLNINASGRVTKPYQPAFSGYRNAGLVTNATAIHNIVNLNVGSHYNSSTGLFTCPIAGYYLVSCAGHAENFDVTRIQIRVNNSNVRYTYNRTGGANYVHQCISSVVYCNANDTISMYVEGTMWGGDLSGVMMDIYLLG